MSKVKNCMPPPAGVYTALITPFTDPGGGFLLDALERNVAFQLAHGVKGLVPTGTTGESAALDWRQHHHVIQQTVRAAAGRAYVLAGTGSNNTLEAVRASNQALGDGADGVLLVDCYYNRPSSLQLRGRYYEALAQSIAKDYPAASLVPYVIPKRTGTKLEPVDLAILTETCPNVRAVKEATGDLDNMRKTRQLVGPDFLIFSGDDNMTAAMMADSLVAANGVISVMSNIVPGPIVQMVNAFERGDFAEGNRINAALAPFFSLVGLTVPTFRRYHDRDCGVVDAYPNPCPIKAMMQLLGMDSGYLQPPLGPMSADAINIVRQALLKVWNENPWVLQPIEAHYGVSIAERLGGTGQGQYIEEYFQRDLAEYRQTAASREIQPTTT